MDPQEERRQRAIRRVEAKRSFRMHLAVYVVVNAFLVFIWGTTSPGDYFWPIWPMAGWGIGLAFHAWATFGLRSISETEIQREMERDRTG